MPNGGKESNWLILCSLQNWVRPFLHHWCLGSGGVYILCKWNESWRKSFILPSQILLFQIKGHQTFPAWAWIVNILGFGSGIWFLMRIFTLSYFMSFKNVKAMFDWLTTQDQSLGQMCSTSSSLLSPDLNEIMLGLQQCDLISRTLILTVFTWHSPICSLSKLSVTTRLP